MSKEIPSDEREERMDRLTRALARHLPASTAREMIEQALEQAGLTVVPPAGELIEFVERQLSEVLSTRVGPSVAAHWLKSLRTELAKQTPASPRPAEPLDTGVRTSIDAWLGRVLLGRYRLLQKVSDGRRGAMYRAERVGDGARIAIKLVEPAVHQSQERFEQRLTQEFEMARSLAHANTLHVHELGRADERWMFMAVEWLSGIDLARMLSSRGPLTARQAMHLGHQAARSLTAAHERGVVHGDLTPHSLFVAKLPNGQSVVKVMDYGRRRLSGYNEEGYSQVGLPTGWARYLAPEQIVNDDYDPRCDVYALGAVLYEALCGELPFKDSTGIGILMAQVHERAPALRSRTQGAQVSEAVEALVMRCLEKDPNDRFASMEEVAQESQALAR
jgi:serine/threonine-protein kinase